MAAAKNAQDVLDWLLVRPAVALRNFSHGSTIRAAAISKPNRTSCSPDANAPCCLSSRATTPAMVRTIVVLTTIVKRNIADLA